MTDITMHQRRNLNYNSLAMDLVLYGQEDLPGVMRAYGLDEFDLEELLSKDELLRQQMKRLRKQVEADPKAILRMKATSAVESNIPKLNLVVANADEETKDRINAMRLLAELADALPKSARDGGPAGVMLQFNFGGLTVQPGEDLPKPVNVINHGA